MEQLQDALKAALYSEKDSTHADSPFYADDFIRKVAILIVSLYYPACWGLELKL